MTSQQKTQLGVKKKERKKTKKKLANLKTPLVFLFVTYSSPTAIHFSCYCHRRRHRPCYITIAK